MSVIIVQENSNNIKKDEELIDVIKKEITERQKIDFASKVICELIDIKKSGYLEKLECEHDEKMKEIHQHNIELEEANKLGDKEWIKQTFHKILNDASKA